MREKGNTITFKSQSFWVYRGRAASEFSSFLKDLPVFSSFDSARATDGFLEVYGLLLLYLVLCSAFFWYAYS